ncbi:carbohydrate-binding protein [Parachryseolinea silvisoli]|uniref:carbohydrate-binding protein n=1 Tax=Parachryseolinea silvisoli TaxID=2873601 RepID=UPI002265BE2B|nr:carbohydrate-binding protein [Parachryseolinea silvisoli]MCD9018831.1 carbohydrate-binding protein [Parachryseolinea silvisoli]
MTNLTLHVRIIAVLLSCFVYYNNVSAQITWPQGQLLPSFPATAQTQDLINWGPTSVLGNMTRWEAEGTSLGHKTGRLETDGWLCQVGIDAPNEHMIYGPYVTNVPAGPNIAEFRMKIDNNTANNDPVVDIDVRNATTGASLAFQTITRQQFSIAANYTSFRLPFTMPADNQAIELRVYWRGGAYIKVDWVGVQADNTVGELLLFTSLKGIVNRTQPRIFSYEGDAFAEGPYTWLQSLGLSWTEVTNRWSLITKYRSELNGLIVYDPAQIHTINLATTLAKDKKALIVSPAFISTLTAAPYNLPVLMDLRGQFTSKLQVYQTLFNTYWPGIDHRLLVGLSPEAHVMGMREYAVALGAATIWLDPAVAGESELLNSFLSSMPAGANFMGWWPEEGAGVTRASQYGIATVASDYATNLSVHSGMPRTIAIKPIPAKPALQNKIYVAFIISDGDNLQYVEHLMRKLWNNPDRGSVPIGWTVSPAMVDAMPGALNFYHQTATTNDNLISGPSGYGYAYPNNFPNQPSLDQFVVKTEEYNRRAGLRVLTVWNTITGGINQNVGQSYATYAPSLLGLTAQNTGGPLSIYNQSLPGFPLSCNYCWNEQNIKEHIANAAAGWNGTEPRFIIIQSQPWQDIKPSNFKNVANSLGANYVVVRPDHIFQLIREKNGLPTDPGPARIATVYKDCNYSGTSTGLDAGDYNLTRLQSLGIQDDDISSLRLTQGYKIILYQDDNFTGGSLVVTSDLSCFDATWNDKVTSLRILANTPASTLIQAESYSNMSGIQTEPTTDTGGGLNVGYADTGDWMAYSNIHFPTTGSYLLEYRVASAVNGARISADLNAGTMQLGALDVPNTGAWQNWQTISHTVNVSAGTYNFGVFIQNSGVNINWIRITYVAPGATARTVSPTLEKEETATVGLYPNPVENTLYFSAAMKGAKVSIANLQTTEVLSETRVEENGVDVSALKPGLYFVILTQDGNRTVKRFIKK